MTDYDKVLNGLECHAEVNCVECPYRDGWRTCPFGETLLADTIALLKEQQETIASLQSTINKLTKALAGKPEQKVFVHSDGTIEPLQKHGHWNVVQESYDDEQHWQCSECGCEWYLEAGNPKENNMHYCPECGALMDEVI